MAVQHPVIGHWYRRGNRKLFEVVAIDDDDATIELQHFDGTVEEIDFENWRGFLIDEAGAPEDWSGSVDVNPEDEPSDVDGRVVSLWLDPLAELERTESD